jgi:predicted RNase H-like HicB family nuclease
VSGAPPVRIAIEEAQRNFSAFSPDLPGCIATGPTRSGVMAEATRFHLEGLIAAGLMRSAAADIVLRGLAVVDPIQKIYISRVYLRRPP